MSWEDIVKKQSDISKMDYIIKILEASKENFDNSKSSQDGSIRQASKMCEEAINYAQEIKEKLQ
tara:strand:+ start:1099 stop:1290 length:192 start_codon:yes stop_codon:yes gene_type:complete